MEISSLFDKLEGLLPILIFVIWAIISAVGAAGSKTKKRGPQGQSQQQHPQQRQAPASQPSHSSRERESERPSTSISDELNRTLDVLFGNQSADKGQSRGQPRSEQVRKAPPPAPAHNKKRTAQKVSDRSSMKKGTSAADTVKAIERSAQINRKAQSRSIERPAVSPDFSAAEAVKGVVWSEILQPPVAMRGAKSLYI
ncbi:MAG: hypothetical protein FWE57_02125 [Chitinispirillia bacterium]|nr:hypothetical protein [Chitinispirillia bacterium]